jgi:hypothetical protein
MNYRNGIIGCPQTMHLLEKLFNFYSLAGRVHRRE